MKETLFEKPIFM